MKRCRPIKTLEDGIVIVEPPDSGDHHFTYKDLERRLEELRRGTSVVRLTDRQL